MSIYNGVAANPVVTNAELPDDALDKVDAASVNPVFAGLLDNDANMQLNKLPKAGGTMTGLLVLDAGASLPAGDVLTLTDETSKIKLGASGFSRTRARGVPLYDPADWTLGKDGSLTNPSSTSKVVVYVFDDVPDGADITGAAVFVDPANGHVAIPAFLPRIELWLLDITTGTSTQIEGTVQDPNTGSTAVFDAHHTITITVDPVVAFDASKHRLTLYLASEGSTDALADFKAVGAQVAFTQKHLES